MIKVLVGDLFESEAQTLVNTVNCVGIMGKGIALGFKTRFPDMFKEYRMLCERGEMKLGEPYLYKSIVYPWILNFPTKDHWRSLTKIEDVVAGLEHITDNYKDWGVTSLAVPPLGSGLGQLEWRIVGPILHKYLSGLEIDVELYAPYETPTDELELKFLETTKNPHQLALKNPLFQRINPAWIALVEILRRVEKEPYRWPIGRTSFQKMAFLAQSKGLPLELSFSKGSYGPHTPELKKKISQLLNNGLVRESRRHKMFEIFVGDTYAEVRQPYLSDIDQWENIIQEVSDLFTRINTSRAEVIATAVFAAEVIERKKGSIPSELDVINYVVEWKKERSPAFRKNEIAKTVRGLAALGWLKVEASKNTDAEIDVFADE